MVKRCPAIERASVLGCIVAVGSSVSTLLVNLVSMYIAKLVN